MRNIHSKKYHENYEKEGKASWSQSSEGKKAAKNTAQLFQSEIVISLFDGKNITVRSLGVTRAVLHVFKLTYDSINCLMIMYTAFKRLIQFDVKTGYFLVHIFVVLLNLRDFESSPFL